MKRLLLTLGLILGSLTTCFASTGVTVNAGSDGSSQFLIFVTGTALDDDIFVELTDSIDDGEVEYLQAEIYDGNELVSTLTVSPSQAESMYIVIRSWAGADTIEIDSDWIVRPELFTIYCECGSGADDFDGSNCTSRCIVRGGTENDVIEGGWANDDLAGGDGYDEIYGRYGNDVLSGGYDEYEDLLRGGWGSDRLGKDIYKPIQDRAGNYVYTLVHTENYDDFNADDGDTITELRYRMPSTRSRK